MLTNAYIGVLATLFGHLSTDVGQEFSAGNVMVSDRGSNVIVEYGPSGELIRSLGNGQESFQEPWGLAFGPDGRLYVGASTSGDLFAVSGAGEFERFENDGNRAQPRALAFGPGGRLVVASRGNNVIVILNSAMLTEAVVPCPPGHGQPAAVTFDRRGRLWVGSEESKSVFVLDIVTGMIGSEVVLPAAPADIGFFGSWIMVVTVPSTNDVYLLDALAATLLNSYLQLPAPTGYAPGNDGGSLVVVRGTKNVLRTNFGAFGDTIWGGVEELSDPVDIVTVPWRFRVKLKGAGYAHGVGGPLPTKGKKIVEMATLSVQPGTDQLLVELDTSGTLASSTWFGTTALVLQGGGTPFTTKDAGGAIVGSFHQVGHRVGGEVDSSAVVSYRRKPISGSFDKAIVDVSGTLHISRFTDTDYNVMNTKVSVKKVLNKK